MCTFLTQTRTLTDVHGCGTHRERLSTLLDHEAFYEVGEDVTLDYGLGRFVLSIVLAAVSVPTPRGHDWSTSLPSPANTSSAYQGCYFESFGNSFGSITKLFFFFFCFSCCAKFLYVGKYTGIELHAELDTSVSQSGFTGNLCLNCDMQDNTELSH